MRLYLVRHAEAKPKEEDPERHLSARGLKDVRKVAKLLRPLGLRAGALWHSGKTRAAETAEVLASAIKSEEGLVQRDGLAPDDDVRPVAREIERARADLALVGHQPFLSLLASRLLLGQESADVLAIPTAAVVCLDCGERGQWRIAWMIVPDLVP